MNAKKKLIKLASPPTHTHASHDERRGITGIGRTHLSLSMKKTPCQPPSKTTTPPPADRAEAAGLERDTPGGLKYGHTSAAESGAPTREQTSSVSRTPDAAEGAGDAPVVTTQDRVYAVVVHAQVSHDEWLANEKSRQLRPQRERRGKKLQSDIHDVKVAL